MVLAHLRGPASFFPSCVILIGAEPHGRARHPQAVPPSGGPFRWPIRTSRNRDREDFKGRLRCLLGLPIAPTWCPTTLFDIGQIMAALGPMRTAPVRCSSRSSEARPQSVLKVLHVELDPQCVAGLTGDLPSITKVANEYRAYFTRRRAR